MHSSSDISAMRTENLQIQTHTQKETRDPAAVDPATVLPPRDQAADYPGQTSPPPGKLLPDELPPPWQTFSSRSAVNNWPEPAKLRASMQMEHDSEKCAEIFGKDHAPRRSWSRMT